MNLIPGRSFFIVQLVLESGEIRYLRSNGTISLLTKELADACDVFINRYAYVDHKFHEECFPVELFSEISILLSLNHDLNELQIVRKVIKEEV
jgi:hypothetical protein